MDELRLTDVPDADTAGFEARCGKGHVCAGHCARYGARCSAAGHGDRAQAHACRPASLRKPPWSGRDRGRRQRAGEDLSSFPQLVEVALGITSRSTSARRMRPIVQVAHAEDRGRDAPVLGGTAACQSQGQIAALGEIEKGALHLTRVFDLGG